METNVSSLSYAMDFQLCPVEIALIFNKLFGWFHFALYLYKIVS